MNKDKELLNQVVEGVVKTLQDAGFNVKLAKPKKKPKPFYYLVCAWVDENESNEFEEFSDREKAKKRAKEILLAEPKYKFVEVKKFKTTTRDLIWGIEYRIIKGKFKVVDTW